MLPVTKIMTRDVFSLAPDATVREAACELYSRGHGGAPVLDERGQLVGMVTKGDLLRGLSVGEQPVRTVMRTTIPAVRHDSTAMEAIKFMAARGHDWVIVVGPFGLIAGVLTPVDVVRALAAGTHFDVEEAVLYDRMSA